MLNSERNFFKHSFIFLAFFVKERSVVLKKNIFSSYLLNLSFRMIDYLISGQTR